MPYFLPSPEQVPQHEKDPNIDCLIVEQVGDRQMERLTSFVTRLSKVKKLEWKPIVAVLR
jgi:hypothetical protein